MLLLRTGDTLGRECACGKVMANNAGPRRLNVRLQPDRWSFRVQVPACRGENGIEHVRSVFAVAAAFVVPSE